MTFKMLNQCWNYILKFIELFSIFWLWLNCQFTLVSGFTTNSILGQKKWSGLTGPAEPPTTDLMIILKLYWSCVVTRRNIHSVTSSQWNTRIDVNCMCTLTRRAITQNLWFMGSTRAFIRNVNIIPYTLNKSFQKRGCEILRHFSPLPGERGGSVVECRTPEREVRGSRPTAAVLCPWARHFTPRKYWLITQEAMAPSRHDWKIVDWDVKPQHNQLFAFYKTINSSMETYRLIC